MAIRLFRLPPEEHVCSVLGDLPHILDPRHRSQETQ
jgi:hypothetical protein